MTRHQNAIVPATERRALVRAWVKRCLPADAEVCGVNELGIWYDLPPPSRSTGLVPWKDVQSSLAETQKETTGTKGASWLAKGW